MDKMLWVGFGGFVGAILRFTLSERVQKWTKSTTYPHGMWVVNLLGCFVIGMLSQVLETKVFLGTEARLFIFIGLLGAFTTFSTFGNDTVNLLRGGKTLYALGNIAVHVVLGLGMVWLGRTLGELFG